MGATLNFFLQNNGAFICSMIGGLSYIDHTLWQTHVHQHIHLGLNDPLFQGSGAAKTFPGMGGGGTKSHGMSYPRINDLEGGANKKSSFTKADSTPPPPP